MHRWKSSKLHFPGKRIECEARTLGSGGSTNAMCERDELKEDRKCLFSRGSEWGDQRKAN